MPDDESESGGKKCGFTYCPRRAPAFCWSCRHHWGKLAEAQRREVFEIFRQYPVGIADGQRQACLGVLIAAYYAANRAEGAERQPAAGGAGGGG